MIPFIVGSGDMYITQPNSYFKLFYYELPFKNYYDFLLPHIGQGKPKTVLSQRNLGHFYLAILYFYLNIVNSWLIFRLHTFLKRRQCLLSCLLLFSTFSEDGLRNRSLLSYSSGDLKSINVVPGLVPLLLCYFLPSGCVIMWYVPRSTH